jgi:hypothetical protein
VKNSEVVSEGKKKGNEKEGKSIESESLIKKAMGKTSFGSLKNPSRFKNPA